ncbi:uncharacterized protein DUF1904 [Aneurinibacillus soli]|uniref:Uncharacterized protein n=1 Tax=Aneurinibacillus soli TaxID=1500254 RepID=A0A0U5AQ64_9BACL|nr:DUF1904 family protein [Aneurinibacillus soli]PYE58061.1 uncharacterized protein DUF1904 [Aneurinibacillus soli]BAU25962.1 hypothetical protein CB4_00013 [Aneurinibacillus soli]
MPFLRFAGVEKDRLQELAPSIIREVARTIQISEEKIKIELLAIEQITNTPPSLEISMFQREQSKHDTLAARLYELLKRNGYATIHIFFVILTPSLYYKEGSPLKEIAEPISAKLY